MKVRMAFALKAKVGETLLEELRNNADIEVNEKSQIIKYKERRTGGLMLSAYDNEDDPITISQTDRLMMQLIHNLSNSSQSRLSYDLFIETYRASTGSTESEYHLTDRYRIVKNRIFESADFDLNTRTKMIYITKTMITNEVLAELRKTAHVELYNNGLIKNYVARDGSLTLVEKVAFQEWSDAEQHDLIEFCVEKCQNVQFPVDLIQLIREFKESIRSNRSVAYLEDRIACLKVTDFSASVHAETRVKTLFSLKIRISDDVLNELRQNAVVELNPDGCIEN